MEAVPQGGARGWANGRAFGPHGQWQAISRLSPPAKIENDGALGAWKGQASGCRQPPIWLTPNANHPTLSDVGRQVFQAIQPLELVATKGVLTNKP